MNKDEKLDHIKRCEFHKRIKKGNCPLISFEEAKELLDEDN